MSQEPQVLPPLSTSVTPDERAKATAPLVCEFCKREYPLPEGPDNTLRDRLNARGMEYGMHVTTEHRDLLMAKASAPPQVTVDASTVQQQQAQTQPQPQPQPQPQQVNQVRPSMGVQVAGASHFAGASQTRYEGPAQFVAETPQGGGHLGGAHFEAETVQGGGGLSHMNYTPQQQQQGQLQAQQQVQVQAPLPAQGTAQGYAREQHFVSVDGRTISDPSAAQGAGSVSQIGVPPVVFAPTAIHTTIDGKQTSGGNGTFGPPPRQFLSQNPTSGDPNLHVRPPSYSLDNGAIIDPHGVSHGRGLQPGWTQRPQMGQPLALPSGLVQGPDGQFYQRVAAPQPVQPAQQPPPQLSQTALELSDFLSNATDPFGFADGFVLYAAHLLRQADPLSSRDRMQIVGLLETAVALLKNALRG